MPSARHPITGCRADSLLDPIWCIEAEYFAHLVDVAATFDLEALAKEAAEHADDEPAPRYTVRDGIAMIPVIGPITKYPTSFSRRLGGASTVEIQKALRDSRAEESVKAVQLEIDSRGGTVAGVPELAEEIRKTDAIKPVHAAIIDNATSGALWLASQARHVTANRTARIGSIGTMALLRDESKKMEAAGVKVIPIVSGFFKGAGAPGTSITPEQQADFQRQINDINEHFIGAIASSRKLHPAVVRAHEARIYLGEAAKAHGLIDEISTAEESHAAMVAKYVNPLDPSSIAALDTPALSPSTGAPMPVTPEQLAKVKGLVGANLSAQVTDATAADHVIALADGLRVENESLKTKLQAAEARAASGLPAPQMDEHTAAFTVRALETEFAAAVAEGTANPNVASELKSMLLENGKPSALAMAQCPGSSEPFAFRLAGLLRKNKAVKPGEQSGAQVISRPIPGQSDAPPDAAQARADEAKKLREDAAAWAKSHNKAAVA